MVNKKMSVSEGFEKARGKVAAGWDNTAAEVKYGAAAVLGLAAAITAVVLFKKRK